MVAHYEKVSWIDDWMVDFIGIEESAKKMYDELCQQRPNVTYHLFAEVEAQGAGFVEV